jgi:DNA-binding transcriptional LysR family regulator
MELRQLQVLVAIAEHGSFSAAADALSTVQSNVSTHLRKLEQELGTELIDRSTGRLSEAGELVVARARRINAELDSLSSDVGALASEITGVVRTGIIGTTARWLVPQLLELVPIRHPHLRLVFIEATTSGLDSQLAAGLVDLAILNLPALGSELATVPLFYEELVLVVERTHTLASRSVVDLREISTVPLLLPLTGTAFRDELDAMARAKGVELRARAELDSTRLIASLTFEGCGPAILPASAVPSYLRDDWSVVEIDGLQPRLIGMAQRRWGLPSAAARAVLEILTEILADPARRPALVQPVTELAVRARPAGSPRTAAPSITGTATNPSVRATSATGAVHRRAPAAPR